VKVLDRVTSQKFKKNARKKLERSECRWRQLLLKEIKAIPLKRIQSLNRGPLTNDLCNMSKSNFF
jgi:hypothetical protein